MSKKTEIEEVKANNVAETEVVIDYKAKWKEARENLIVQLKDHLEKSEHHKTMSIKAQGAIEVGDQIYLEEENGEG
tara:strand:- start:198 stop:425 length:228 start_codon:yes stop_codon:yes gene_type:complete